MYTQKEMFEIAEKTDIFFDFVKPEVWTKDEVKNEQLKITENMFDFDKFETYLLTKMFDSNCDYCSHKDYCKIIRDPDLPEYWADATCNCMTGIKVSNISSDEIIKLCL